MAGRHGAVIEALRAAVFDAAAVTPGEAREAAASGADLPEPLASFLTKVREASYKITDGDVEQLRAAGHSEEEIFELTVAAALGAALQRRDRAIRALGLDN